MKNLLTYLSLLITATTIAYSLAPVTVVLRNDGNDLTVKLNNYSSGTAAQVGTVASRTIPSVTPNGSGYSSFVVGASEAAWDNISVDSVNSNVILDVYDNNVLIAQFRLDQLMETTARNEKLPANLVVDDKLTVGGDLQVVGKAVFQQDVEVKGQLALSSSTFSNAGDLQYIQTNIMVYDNFLPQTVTEDDFSPFLLDGATYTILNKTSAPLTINLSNGTTAVLYDRNSAVILKLNGELNFIGTFSF